MSEPLLSIVVGTIDRPKLMQQCINSVIANTGVPWEMIVTDASRDPFKPARADSRIHIMREQPRLGHSKGYNRAFQEARGKWVCWLNDDVEVLPDWANNAVAFMQWSPWCGLGCFYYSEHGGDFHINEWLGFIYANFGILSKEFGEHIGWFDECVRMYGADNSITFKTILSGRGVAGIPGAKLMHRPICDTVREENVAGQSVDAQRLMAKYQPYVEDMQSMMRQFPASALRIS